MSLFIFRGFSNPKRPAHSRDELYPLLVITLTLICLIDKDCLQHIDHIDSMAAALKKSWKTPGPSDNWTLKFEHFPESNSFAVSNSDGAIFGYSFTDLSQPLYLLKHETSVSSMARIDPTTLVSCATDGVKVWDLRSSKATASFSNTKQSAFLLVAYSQSSYLVAGGTEKVSIDAEVHLWDIRKPGSAAYKSFVDSHNDDVTYLTFHPTQSQYLMSGSTDGYVNVYDLTQDDEEDALHQVINYASVHLCKFLTENKISILSHMESLRFDNLFTSNYEDGEKPEPRDLGDVRTLWPNCEYVVDVYPGTGAGYIAYGANSEQLLTVVPFDPNSEHIDLDNAITFPKAHGEEVIRDVLVLPGTSTALTCGEDGYINIWEMPSQLPQMGALNINEVKQTDAIVEDKDMEEAEDSKKEKRKHKSKHKHKDKKKKRKDVKYKPY